LKMSRKFTHDYGMSTIIVAETSLLVDYKTLHLCHKRLLANTLKSNYDKNKMGYERLIFARCLISIIRSITATMITTTAITETKMSGTRSEFDSLLSTKQNPKLQTKKRKFPQRQTLISLYRTAKLKVLHCHNYAINKCMSKLIFCTMHKLRYVPINVFIVVHVVGEMSFD